MISDHAFDRLKGIYERDRTLWAAVHACGSIRKLATAHGINPDL
jgi:hypothetical protein